MSPFRTALPTARTPDPQSAPPLRWGIYATGGIAAKFVSALQRHTAQQVVAVGSRTTDRAEAFAAQYGIDRAHGSYQALVDDPGVDVIYVATPHSGHREGALAAIAAGKHVLVEKAFTRNAAEAIEVAEAARAAGVLVMEAMWTRYLPQSDVIRQLLADGALGEVTTVFADHGQYFANLDAGHRLLNPDLAGGALLDLGIYPVSFAHFALGQPDEVVAQGSLAPTGVDAQISMTMTAGRAQAVLNTTLLAETPTTAAIAGSAARIELTGPFYAPATLTLTEVRGHSLVRGPDEIAGHQGLCYQAAALATYVAEGRTDSPLLPLDESVAIMRTLDDVRGQVGVRFPGE